MTVIEAVGNLGPLRLRKRGAAPGSAVYPNLSLYSWAEWTRTCAVGVESAEMQPSTSEHSPSCKRAIACGTPRETLGLQKNLDNAWGNPAHHSRL